VNFLGLFAIMSNRYDHVQRSLGGESLKVISKARVLVVGAGGIGCEVLKNLVLTGFKYIEVIDLDTIDVSNLNRQFLFRPEHVGKSKVDISRIEKTFVHPQIKSVNQYFIHSF